MNIEKEDWDYISYFYPEYKNEIVFKTESMKVLCSKCYKSVEAARMVPGNIYTKMLEQNSYIQKRKEKQIYDEVNSFVCNNCK
jgi:hypothetical protein